MDEANRSVLGRNRYCHNSSATSVQSPKSHTSSLYLDRKYAYSLSSLGSQLALTQPFLARNSFQRSRAAAHRIRAQVPPCLFTKATATHESMCRCTLSPCLISSCSDSLAASSSLMFMGHGCCCAVHCPWTCCPPQPTDPDASVHTSRDGVRETSEVELWDGDSRLWAHRWRLLLAA